MSMFFTFLRPNFSREIRFGEKGNKPLDFIWEMGTPLLSKRGFPSPKPSPFPSTTWGCCPKTPRSFRPNSCLLYLVSCYH